MAKCQDPNCNCTYGICGADRPAIIEDCPKCEKTPSEQAAVKKEKEEEKESRDNWMSNWNPYPFDD